MTAEATYTVDSGEIAPIETAEVVCLPREITKNLQHAAEGLGLFIDRYKNKPRLASLNNIFLKQVQDLEDALFELITERTIDAAVGVQLDILGDIVGQPDRVGLSDDDYRTIIRARIKVNRSDGKAEQLIEILVLIATALSVLPLSIEFTDYPPAGFILQLNSDIGALDPLLAFQLLNDARGAGIKFQFVFTTEPEAETFEFASAVTPPELDTDKGFGSTTTAVGGKLSSVISA